MLWRPSAMMEMAAAGLVVAQLLPATDLEIEAGTIALICHYGWQIELFFKCLKSIPGWPRLR